uniref:Heat stress transcription factor B-2a-like n=1 Tax=Crassostrea virginica TaxID=6565 RepID=A0A8B8E8R3_CRAVI|nr:heat stress transcription factor B-2a-like [Crassostrea virginica]
MDIEPILPNSNGQIVRFPVKLRKIIDTCSTQAISWNQEGTIIRINKRLFEREYLAKENRPFQTTSFSSFIRQLNFYGFQKVNQRPSSLGTWLPFRNSLADNIKQLPEEGVLSTSPEVQLYVVGSNGVLVPVETAMVLNTNIYHVLPCGTGSDVDSQTAKSQQPSTPSEAFQPIESHGST